MSLDKFWLISEGLSQGSAVLIRYLTAEFSCYCDSTVGDKLQGLSCGLISMTFSDIPCLTGW